MRDRETESLWPTHEGVALDGPLRSIALSRVPAYQCLLGEWLEEHPDSTVLSAAPHPTHRDLRHGHGSWFYIGSPGLPPHPIHSMESEKLDPRLRENELVLGINDPRRVIAFPLREIHNENCVINGMLGDDPAVVWCRGPASYWTAAFERRSGDRVLDFERAGARFRDRQTGTLWNVEGRAIEGPLRGSALRPLDFTFLKWHVWAPYHPMTQIYRSASSRPKVEAADFASLFGHLSRSGFSVEPDREVLSVWLSPRALRGFHVRISGDRFLALRFDSAAAAEDYARSRLLLPQDLLRSFFPDDPPSDIPRRAVACGSFVLESDPEDQFADEASVKRLPEEKIAWSRLPENSEFQLAVGGVPVSDEPKSETNFQKLFRVLEDAGYPVERPKPMVSHWLRSKALNGFSAAIGGDDFLIYHFPDTAKAAEYCRSEPHTMLAGPFVLRSNPSKQYQVSTEEALDRDPDQIPWSRLLQDEEFRRAAERLSPAEERPP